MEIVFHPSEKALKRRRVWELDFLRGVCILMMVFDHFMLDLWGLQWWTPDFYLHSDTLAYKLSCLAYDYWISEIRKAIRTFVLFSFLFISGISCTLSKNNNLRLGKLALASVVLSIITILLDLFFDMGVTIIFGILHIMALSLLIYILLTKLSKNKYLLLIIGCVFLIIGIIIDFSNIPSTNEKSFKNILRMLVGLVNIGADSYGVVPYTGVYLIGAYFGKTVYSSRTSLVPLFDGAWHTPITFVGRNTIWVYLIHQPVVFVIAMIVAWQSGLRPFF